ncbi:MAG TPA: tetratricopeptide repeat protein [Rhizobiaceae bacterium]|nr:tetratricopeptide repeat protein [Rhizobiaceae bacterium]
MTTAPLSGAMVGLVGALAAFPRRLAAREVERQHGQLQRGVTRRTTHVVFGRSLLEHWSDADIAARFEAETKAGRQIFSENGFLRLLGLLDAPEASTLPRQSLIDQSGLTPRAFALLTLFDAFEHDAEPYSFRDLILARKYAGLIAGGATWSAIARSVHRSGPVASLTALSLQAQGRDAIYARLGDNLSELDGQMLLPIPSPDDTEIEELFATAEALETEERFEEAAAAYQRCLAIDPRDSVAAFNRANCLRMAGLAAEAAHAYKQALKLDPDFAEAWFNLGGLQAERGHVDSARRTLARAIALDHTYGDAVFNLAKLEYDAGHLLEARRWWIRYMELDPDSEWARTAARGVQYVDLHLAHKSAG